MDLRWVFVAAALAAGAAEAQAQVGKPLSKRHQEAYDKAKAYLLENFQRIPFPSKIVLGFALLADGTQPDELARLIEDARNWEASLSRTTEHGKNWHPGLAALFLAEAYKFDRAEPVKESLEGLVRHFEKNQEPTGGWFKWTGGGLGGKYPAPDLAMLTATIYSSLITAKRLGVKVPQGVIDRADQCLNGILSSSGLGYGTGNGSPDKTGGRIGLAMLGPDYAGMSGHPFCQKAARAVVDAIPRLDQGHHWGGLHAMAVTLACHRLGSGAYSQLASAWLDRLIAGQDASGGVYVGDDGEAGGEKGLLGGNHSSTAAFMLMILLQDRDRLDPDKRKKAGEEKAEGGSERGGGSPFSKKKATE